MISSGLQNPDPSRDEKPRISIVIVTYNSQLFIVDCLNALPWHLHPEVILIDNHSADRTVSQIKSMLHEHPERDLRLQVNSRNLNYARGINQGLRAARGDFILILGPDTQIQWGGVETLLETLYQNARGGVAAPQLITPEGKIQPSCRRFPTFRDLFLELSGLPRFFKRPVPWKMEDFDHLSFREVEQPEASCLLIRRRALQQVGYMDPRFPLFFNDVDWCRRFYLAGWTILFQPEARVIHVKGGTIYQHRIASVWKSHQGFFRYFQKYKQGVLQTILCGIAGFSLMGAAVFRSLLIMITGEQRRF